jgi:hypothetical protein
MVSSMAKLKDRAQALVRSASARGAVEIAGRILDERRHRRTAVVAALEGVDGPKDHGVRVLQVSQGEHRSRAGAASRQDAAARGRSEKYEARFVAISLVKKIISRVVGQ